VTGASPTLSPAKKAAIGPSHVLAHPPFPAPTLSPLPSSPFPSFPPLKKLDLPVRKKEEAWSSRSNNHEES